MMTVGFVVHGGFYWGDFLFQLVPILFIVVLGVILFSLFKNLKEWNYNNKQPQLTVPAIIVTKRTKVSRTTHSHNHHLHSNSHTNYFVTFEVESGDRMELHVKENEFGLLAEGDKGRLTFQGTRFIGYDRVL